MEIGRETEREGEEEGKMGGYSTDILRSELGLLLFPRGLSFNF